MIQAGLILQEAAAIYDDLNAHHVQSYGPEARGNTARSEVIISAGEIDYPKVTKIDAFVATTQEAVDAYVEDLQPGAAIIVDAELVTAPPEGALRLALVAVAERQLGRPALLPIVALGALVERTSVVSRSAIEAAVKAHVAKGTEDIHQKALEEGYRLVREASKQS